jgi:uncharacterized protein YkwD
MRTRPPLLTLLALLAIVFSSNLARATDVAIQGGPGGGAFRLSCPNNMFMLGVALRSGAWVDAIRGNCLAFNSSTGQFVAPPQFTNFAGGTGGAIQQNGCSLDRYMAAIKIGFTRDGNKPKYLDYVEMTCRVITGYGGDTKVCLNTGNGCWDRHPSPGPYNGFGLAFTLACPANQAATGLFGRAGSYVDAVGLICGPKPVPGTQTSSTPPTSSGPTGDMLTMFNEHNRHRADHCTPALKWSATLASHAQTSADRCSNSHNTAELDAQQEGENLYNGNGAGFTTPKAASDFWYNEWMNYNFDTPVLVLQGKMNGHFTQMVWKDTTEIGCAAKVCSNGTFYSCRYHKRGNWNALVPQTDQATAQANLRANVAKKCK